MNLEEFLTASGPGGCKLARHMQELPQADRSAVEQALHHDAVTSTAIADVLDEHGYEISADVVQRHRRGACACSKRGRLAQLASDAELGVAQ